MGEMTRVGDNAIVRRLEDAKKRGEAQGHLAEAIEMVLIQGDLAKLKPEERVTYYNRVCESLGLNPLTKPFAYINLNGKLTLYALKDATEQLRKIHGVSIEKLETDRHEDVFVVKAYARDRTGRTDAATGAVPLGNLKGENLANAIMKAETKAKRRATLSICGLGMLDEIEVESIPAQREPLVIDAPAKPMLTEAQEREADIPRVEYGDGRIATANGLPIFPLSEAQKAQIAKDDAARLAAQADEPAPRAQPLYAMQVKPRMIGKLEVADVTLSDGRLVMAKGSQMVGYLMEACQSQAPLDITTMTKVSKKGESVEWIDEVRGFKQTLREELEASIAQGPKAEPEPSGPALDEIPFSRMA